MIPLPNTSSPNVPEFIGKSGGVDVAGKVLVPRQLALPKVVIYHRALQMHPGPPMKVQFKNLVMKTLK